VIMVRVYTHVTQVYTACKGYTRRVYMVHNVRPTVRWDTNSVGPRSDPKNSPLDGNASLIVSGGPSLMHPRYGLGLKPYREMRDATLSRGQEGGLFDRSVSGPFRCYEIYMRMTLRSTLREISPAEGGPVHF
jgi:hypothetical protein